MCSYTFNMLNDVGKSLFIDKHPHILIPILIEHFINSNNRQ
jgi:hypothetical protein